MDIVYTLEPDLAAEEFKAVLVASTLGARRPVDDLARLDKMLRQADIVVTARHEKKLAGVSRAVCDFSWCCYLSDLAVDEAFQHKGIGKQLIAETHKAAGLNTLLLLVAAPAAEGYYPKIGMQQLPACFIIPRV